MPLSIPPTPVFWCEPTGRIQRYLRCYEPDAVTDLEAPCRGYCNAMVPLDQIDEEFGEPIEDGRRFRKNYEPTGWPAEAFPTKCDRCGREFQNPTRQIFTDEIYEAKTGSRTGEKFVRREAPVGAMWDITYYHDIPQWCGRDGIALMVVTPGGEWHCDGKANNCTKPDDTVHRCWVRRGDPRTGYVHVDKDATIQETCAAGAGSIWQGKDGPRDWHGFLVHGFLCDAGDQGKVDALIAAATAPTPAPVVPPIVAPVIRASSPPRVPSRPTGAVKAFGQWRSSRRR